MKKTMLLLALGLVTLFGCQKEDSILISLDSDSQSIYVLNADGNWQVMEFSEQLNNSTSNVISKKGNSAHAHGEFTGGNGSVMISFNGTQNNGGTHGSAEMILLRGPGRAHLVMETESVTVDGNEATYVGKITKVLENTLPPPPPPPPPPPGVPPPPPPSCSPNDIGTYVTFRVIDNGQGHNAPIDQYNTFIVGTCNAPPNGGTTLPWFIGSALDVEGAKDKIKVN